MPDIVFIQLGQHQFAVPSAFSEILNKHKIPFCRGCVSYHLDAKVAGVKDMPGELRDALLVEAIIAHGDLRAAEGKPSAPAAAAPVEDPKAKAEAALNGVLEDIAKRTVAFSQECQADLIKAAEDAVSGGLEPMSVMEILERAKQREIEKEKPPLTPPAGAIFLAQVFADIASRAPRA